MNITSTGTLAYKPHFNQNVTIAGSTTINSIINYQNKYLLTVTGASNRLIRFNNFEDLTDQTIISLPYTSWATMVIVGNDVYIPLSPVITTEFHTIVLKVDVVNMTYTTVINQTMTDYYPYYVGACTDGTNLYLITGGSFSHFIKYRISDWTKLYDVTNSFAGRGFNIIYGNDGYLYGTSLQQAAGAFSGKNFVVKLNPADMTTVSVVQLPAQNYTTYPGPVNVGTKLFVGFIGNTIDTAHVRVFNTTDLTLPYTSITFSGVSPAGNIQGFVYNNDGIYATANYVPGTNLGSTLVKINPSDNSYQTLLRTGIYGGSVGFNFDGRDIFTSGNNIVYRLRNTFN